ncbi:MAG: hypothetical protein P8179_11900 [Candidatus Thiodiazotropha sp.]
MSQQIVDDLQTVSGARVFFGHQSVGENIITGLQELSEQTQSGGLTISDLESYQPEEGKGSFVHTAVGENTKPKTKCVDFERIIDQELAGKIDFALMKFCYIDINRDSDVAKLFSDYQETLDGLIARHPDITFIHTTAPLRHSPGGFGVWIRETLGQPNNSKLDNQKRNDFNRLLLETYGDASLVDIARSQSTYANGQRESFTMAGQEYYGLIGDYTSDGGHLNELGRHHVAQAFAHDLAQIIRASVSKHKNN